MLQKELDIGNKNQPVDDSSVYQDKQDLLNIIVKKPKDYRLKSAVSQDAKQFRKTQLSVEKPASSDFEFCKEENETEINKNLASSRKTESL